MSPAPALLRRAGQRATRTPRLGMGRGAGRAARLWAAGTMPQVGGTGGAGQRSAVAVQRAGRRKPGLPLSQLHAQQGSARPSPAAGGQLLSWPV